MPDDLAALINRDSAVTALRDYTSRLCTILRSAPDPAAPAIGSWTLGGVANHLGSGVENYALWLQGRDAPDLDEIKNMSQWNIETVRALPAGDLPEFADRIQTATAEFIEATGDSPAGSSVRWYAGNRLPVEVAICMRLIEAAVHGLVIAAAAKARWHISSDDARMMSYGLAYIAPYFVAEERVDFEGTLRMRSISGGQPRRKSASTQERAAAVDRSGLCARRNGEAAREKDRNRYATTLSLGAGRHPPTTERTSSVGIRATATS